MDKLFFYSKSANKPAGKGANEFVENPEDYKVLNGIKNWRKVLSNFYVAPFMVDGKTYNTAEHVFHAEKIRIADQEKADLFTMESKSAIGLGDGAIARKNRRIVVLTEEHLKEWARIKSATLEKILRAKFTQVPVAREILVATRSAVLLHSTRGPPERQYTFEKVRAFLQN